MNNKLNQVRKPYIHEFYRNNKISFSMSVVSTLCMTGINLALSILVKEIIDTISGVPNAKSIVTLVIMSAYIIFALLIAKFIEFIFKPKFFERAILQYKNYAFGKLITKNIGAFQVETNATYLSALTNDIASIETNYLGQIFELISDVSVFFGALLLMVFYNPLLTIISIALSALPIIIAMITGGRLKHAEEKVSYCNSNFTAMLNDALSGYTVIKGFKAEKQIYNLFAESNGCAESAKLSRRKIATFVAAISATSGAITQLGVFLIGAYLAFHTGSITAGVVIAFTNLMNFIITPISEVPGILANRAAAFALIDKLAVALDENTRDDGKKNVNALEEGIRICDLSFEYEPDKRILKHINTFFERGKCYAIVGTSGSGKSTLLNLLASVNKDYAGSIKYDGIELSDICNSSLFNIVSMVQQTVFVFNASIYDNITMFQVFNESEVEQAIERAGLSELIKQRGKDYLCGENGCNLSGGEKQRISLARSLLRKTSILLVDEATAALDKQTAYKVSNEILELSGLTRIVVTHFLDESLLRRYDSIVTLKDGQIIEVGSFKELMDKHGYFYSLFTISQ